MTESADRVFVLKGIDSGQPQFMAALITPEVVSVEKVTRAWSYAVRYSAKGLDLPDYAAALRLLTERHPSWTVFESRFISVKYNPTYAEGDEPET